MSSVLAERLADRVDAIIGVDTHTDTHTAEVVSPVGSVLAELTVTATADGVASLLAWAGEHTNGLGSGRRAWALDSARSHGVGLLRALRTANETVFEAPKPTATARRRGGKSDSLDAVHAARAVLAADHTTTPRRRRPRSPTNPARLPPPLHRHPHRHGQPVQVADPHRRRRVTRPVPPPTSPPARTRIRLHGCAAAR